MAISINQSIFISGFFYKHVIDDIHSKRSKGRQRLSFCQNGENSIFSQHTVDMQNFRKFYHARQDQPELLVGAVKLLLLASLWPQINMTAFLMTRSTWENGTFYTSCALTLANILLLLIYRLSHYNLLIQLFPYHHPEPAVEEEKGEKFRYRDPVPFSVLKRFFRVFFSDLPAGEPHRGGEGVA